MSLNAKLGSKSPQASGNAASDAREDAVEIEKLLAKAKRSGVKAFLRGLLPKAPTVAGPGDEGATAAPPRTTAATSAATTASESASSTQQPVALATPAPVYPKSAFLPIETFAFDGGDSGSTVEVYITANMEGIKEAAKERVTCSYTATSFDLQILDFRGKNYRMLKENLEHDIVPEESKVVVKKNSVVVKLRKKKGKHGFDYWSNLTTKGKKRVDDIDEKNPSAGITDMLKEMYEDGDEKTRRLIGEAMSKKPGDSSLPSFGADDY